MGFDAIFNGGEEFWTYHGWGMSIVWFIGVFIGILLKKKVGFVAHVICMVVIDIITLWLIFKAWTNINAKEIWEKNFISKIHMIFGTCFITQDAWWLCY